MKRIQIFPAFLLSSFNFLILASWFPD